MIPLWYLPYGRAAQARRLASCARSALLASSRRSVTVRRTCSLGSLSSSQLAIVATSESVTNGVGNSQRSAVPIAA